MYFFISLFIIKILKNGSVGSVIQNKRGRETKKEAGHRSWNFQKSWKSHGILFGLEKVMENSLFMKKSWKVMELFFSCAYFFFSGELYV